MRARKRGTIVKRVYTKSTAVKPVKVKRNGEVGGR